MENFIFCVVTLREEMSRVSKNNITGPFVNACLKSAIKISARLVSLFLVLNRYSSLRRYLKVEISISL